MRLNVLIIGATSGIAEAVARRYAAMGCRFFLVARDESKLTQVGQNLKALGAHSVDQCVMDANSLQDWPAVAKVAWDTLGQVDVALIAHGTLPDQKKAETDLESAVREFRNNGESAIAAMTALAVQFERQKSGALAVIGSVAGDRGRGSNYVYGSAKAAVEAFASGLRCRLSKFGVHVMTIKPGFVATPMTQGLPLPEALVASSDKVAAQIVRGIERQTNVLYTPGFWWAIMLIIKLIPEAIFKKLSL